MLIHHIHFLYVIMSLHIVILAAGAGTRMHSTQPKVLHQVGGKPMLEHVLNTATQLNPEQIHIVMGHGAPLLQQHFADFPVNWVLQSEQLGTGHALKQALPHIPTQATVLVLYGDVPLIQKTTLIPLIDTCIKTKTLGLLTVHLDNPFGFGRIVRDQFSHIRAIVEEKDATESEKHIQEVYSGICCVSAEYLNHWLPNLTPKNAQKEYYLTEIVPFAIQDDVAIFSHLAQDSLEVQGVNDRLQLQLVERGLQKRQAEQLMKIGVTLADANRIDIRGEIHCGRDVFIDINTLFEGKVTLGDQSVIGANCILKNVQIGKNCLIHPNTIMEDCVLDDHCTIGPFARIRPGTRLAAQCKIGNFVEAKNAVLGCHTKANHLSYLGDVTIGSEVNIGAGTIICNYDGANKHHTIIEDEVHIGSDTQLIAPVTIGKRATIGAGSTIRQNVPPGELTLTASTQKTVYGWKRPEKKKVE